MKYRTPVIIAVVALVAICLFGSKGTPISTVPVSTPKVVTASVEKVLPAKAKNYEVSFTATISSPTP